MKYFFIFFSLTTCQLHDIVRVLKSNYTPLLPSDEELNGPGLELNESTFYDLLKKVLIFFSKNISGTQKKFREEKTPQKYSRLEIF